MPEQPPVHSHAKLFLWLGLLVAALIAISLAAVFFNVSRQGPTREVTAETIRTGEAPRPAFTEETKQKVAESRGFSALVSYTGTGFEPASVRVSAGQIVRFTNNAAGVLALRIGTAPAYIESQDFYEHEFDQVGDYEYSAGAYSGVVRVQ